MTGVSQNGKDVSLGYDINNRLTIYGESEYTYDVEGNLITEKTGNTETTYVYDTTFGGKKSEMIIVQALFEIDTWTNNIQLFLPSETEILNSSKKYKILAGRAYADFHAGEELVYSEEFGIDTLTFCNREQGIIKIDNMTFFKTKVEKILSYGKNLPELCAGCTGYVLCEINNDKLNNLILFRLLHDEENADIQ